MRMKASVVPESGKITGIVKKNFPVLGMTCAGCAVSVESMLKETKGVLDAGVNYANQTAWAKYDESIVQPLDLQNSVRSVGYDLILDTEDPSKVQEEIQYKNYRELRNRTIWAAVFSIPVVIIGMFFMDLPYGTWISLAYSYIISLNHKIGI